MKPDFSLGFKNKKRELYFFFVEAKRPGQHCSAQPEDDFSKLMKQMKASINQQVILGVHNPLSFGLLSVGYSCSLYQMKLYEDGVYIPTMIKRFKLPENEGDMSLIPGAVEAFFFVKVCI
jgi:hypothetical protein